MRAVALDEKGLPLLLIAALFLALLTAQGVVAVNQAQISNYVVVALVQGAIYLAAAILVLRNPGGFASLVIILVVALLLRAIAMTALPYLTTDAFRYVWDGRLGWEGNQPLSLPAS